MISIDIHIAWTYINVDLVICQENHNINFSILKFVVLLNMWLIWICTVLYALKWRFVFSKQSPILCHKCWGEQTHCEEDWWLMHSNNCISFFSLPVLRCDVTVTLALWPRLCYSRTYFPMNSPVFQFDAPPAIDSGRGQNAHCIMEKCRQTNAAQYEITNEHVSNDLKNVDKMTSHLTCLNTQYNNNLHS